MAAMNVFEALEKGLARPRNSAQSAASEGRPLSQDPLNQILEAARWGASAYNMQPWALQVLAGPEAIQETAEAFSAHPEAGAHRTWILCHLDRSRMLPVADPLGTESYIGLGTLCLNVQLVSAALGVNCIVWGPSGERERAWRPKSFSFADHFEPYILFEFGTDGEPPPARPLPVLVYRLDSYENEVRRDDLPPLPSSAPDALECLRSRQSDRVPFLRHAPWPSDSLHLLRAAQRALNAHGTDAAQLVLAEDEDRTMALTQLQERAWVQATRDRGRFTETCVWMRFTRKEWERHGDGEFIEHLGLTGIKKSIARLGIKTSLAPLAMSLGVHRFLIRRAEVAPETTGAFLTAVLNNADGRIEADEHYRRGILTGVGAAIQALWLTATAVGASLQFQTSTIVQKGPKTLLRSILSIPSDHEPLFLIRMGYPQRDPHYRNIRRKFNEVISRIA